MCHFLIILVMLTSLSSTMEVQVSGRTGQDVRYPVCGANSSPSYHDVNIDGPSTPGPFHDLTGQEIQALRTFLEADQQIKSSKPDNISLNSSFIHMMDLYVANKSDVLDFLDNQGQQPPRQARVVVFRGDLDPPVVQEYICGPLPDVVRCDLMSLPNRRNPAPFSVRPFSKIEFDSLFNNIVIKEVDQKVKHVIEESYQVSSCAEFNYGYLPVGTGILGDINQRKIWLMLTFDVPFYELHPLDFMLLCNTASPHWSDWGIENVWYAGRLYSSLEELGAEYTANRIPKVKLPRPVETDELFSTLHRRGEPMPSKPQRPPLPIEPDGKRYLINDRKVEYLDWSFHFRMSSFSGPALYDIRFKNERIAYELGLSEISVFYSGSSPLPQITNYVDSAAFVGLHSRALVPGGDCPDFSTFINQTFMSVFQEEVDFIDSAFCLFELNIGAPLMRLKSQEPNGEDVYRSVMDSSLTLRSALTIDNYDYIIDFIFHQNGVIETRLISTGFILPSFYRDADRQYGFHLADDIIGNVHHHMAFFKVDLDIHGTRNRFELQEIVIENVTDSSNHRLSVQRDLKRTESTSVYDYDFNRPVFLLVHRDTNTTKDDFSRKAYRLVPKCASKQHIPENQGNEASISWARHQLVVTKQKDSEFSPSSNYAMFDGADPVVDFSQFYNDDENIVDEDIVLWLSCGMHHIPHTEDLPVTPAVGNHLSFFLTPFNYFPRSPLTGSSDQLSQNINTDAKLSSEVSEECLTPPISLEEDVRRNPDLVLQTFRTGYSQG